MVLKEPIFLFFLTFLFATNFWQFASPVPQKLITELNHKMSVSIKGRTHKTVITVTSHNDSVRTALAKSGVVGGHRQNSFFDVTCDCILYFGKYYVYLI